MICPLCGQAGAVRYHQDKFRSYQQCSSCSLVFVPRTELIPEIQEKSRYESHENSSSNADYRNYVQKICETIIPHLNSSEEGLDFGCGRTMLLGELMASMGVLVESTDKFFHPMKIEGKAFDFIILSEVIEHLRVPDETLRELKQYMRPQGKLFVKTKILPASGFENWYYKRDVTHIQFFSQAAFEALARKFAFEAPEFLGNDVWLFRNN